MSFSFSNRFSTKKAEEKNEADNGNNNLTAAQQAASTRNKKTKINPLLLAVTDDYVDDINLYKPRITRAQRYEYWTKLLENKTLRKPNPLDNQSWMAKEVGILNQQSRYPKHLISVFHWINHHYWDQLYLNFFILFLLLLIFVIDGYAASLAPAFVTLNANNFLVALPCLFMVLTQVIPLLGTLYYIHYCNDLVHYLAGKTNFAHWNIVCCLTVQYVEYFHYGGLNRRHLAGHCEIGRVKPPVADGTDNKQQVSLYRLVIARGVNIVKDFLGIESSAADPSTGMAGKKKKRKKNKKIHIDNEEDDDEEDSDEDSDDSDDDDSEDDSGEEDDDDSHSKQPAAADEENQLASATEKQQQQHHKQHHHKKNQDNNNRKTISFAKDVQVMQQQQGDDGQLQQSQQQQPSTATGEQPKGEIGEEKESGDNGNRSSLLSLDGDINSNKQPVINRPSIIINHNLPPGTFVYTSASSSSTTDNNGLQPSPDTTTAASPADRYIDWTCMVCKTQNHDIAYTAQVPWQMSFNTRGLYHSQTYCHLREQSHKPACRKCYTLFDYIPPPATAHLFIHNPSPHIAFTNYPPIPRVQYGLLEMVVSIEQEERSWQVVSNSLRSFCCGKKDNIHSSYIYNNWQLKKYVRDLFPPIPRYSLQANEFYEVGEIIESKLQKAEYMRAKITAIRKNGTYDIQYDAGDELRFVEAKYLRLGFMKGAYAYRMEMSMIILLISLPLGMFLAVISDDLGLAFIGPLIVSLALFLVKLFSFIQLSYNFIDAGICVIFRTSMIFLLPLFFFFLASIIGISSAGTPSSGSWTSIAALFILTKVFALPVLYIMRPPYMIMASILFLQTSIGMILLSNYASANLSSSSSSSSGGSSKSIANTLAVALVPWLTVAFTCKYYRRHLLNIWDVCHVVRPRLDNQQQNQLIWKTWYNSAKHLYDQFWIWMEGVNAK